MIKIIKKFFTSPEQIEDSKVEFVVEVPEKTKTELFDEAVKKVVKEKLAIALKQELIDMCYTKEELEQTKLAIEANKGYYNIRTEDFLSVKKKYPLCIVEIQYSSAVRFGGDFNLDKFVDKLLEGVV